MLTLLRYIYMRVCHGYVTLHVHNKKKKGLLMLKSALAVPSSPGHSQLLILHIEKRESLVREITYVTSPL